MDFFRIEEKFDGESLFLNSSCSRSFTTPVPLHVKLHEAHCIFDANFKNKMQDIHNINLLKKELQSQITKINT